MFDQETADNYLEIRKTKTSVVTEVKTLWEELTETMEKNFWSFLEGTLRGTPKPDRLVLHGSAVRVRWRGDQQVDWW